MKKKVLKQLVGTALVALALLGSLTLIQNVPLVQEQQTASVEQVSELDMEKAISVLP